MNAAMHKNRLAREGDEKNISLVFQPVNRLCDERGRGEQQVKNGIKTILAHSTNWCV